MQIVKDCGLFNMGKLGHDEILYLKHKQLQDYLAALYLSHESTKEHTFHELFYHGKNKVKILCGLMCVFNIVQIVQFASVLSGDFQ